MRLYISVYMRPWTLLIPSWVNGGLLSKVFYLMMMMQEKCELYRRQGHCWGYGVCYLVFCYTVVLQWTLGETGQDERRLPYLNKGSHPLIQTFAERVMSLLCALTPCIFKTLHQNPNRTHNGEGWGAVISSAVYDSKAASRLVFFQCSRRCIQ